MSGGPLRLEGIASRVGGEMYIHPTDLELRAGEANTLLGPTGAGKTSLLRLVAGLDAPTSGRLWLAGRELTALNVRQRRVAFVYQRFVNYPHLDVFENIASPLRVAGVSQVDIEQRVADMAAALELESLLRRRPAELSGGQQQRCALARALVKDADLILLDEPLANLDFKLRERLRDTLVTLLGRRDAVVLYATSDPEEAMILGGCTVVVDGGRVAQAGPARQVYHAPNTTRVAAIVSDPPMNLLPRQRLPELAAAGVERLGIRAHHLHLDPVPGAMTLDVQVELAEINGSSTRLHVRFGDVALIAQAAGVHGFELGAACRLHLHPRDVLSFDAHGARL